MSSQRTRNSRNARPKKGLDHIAEDLRALAVEVVRLTPDPANARKHSRRNIDAVRQSLARFGQRTPLVAQRVGDQLIIRKGNGTYAAAQALGWAWVAVVQVVEDNISATGYAIADNRTAELAEWDGEVLTALLGALEQENEVMLGELGFSDSELSGLLGELERDTANQGVSFDAYTSDTPSDAATESPSSSAEPPTTEPQDPPEPSECVCPKCGHRFAPSLAPGGDDEA